MTEARICVVAVDKSQDSEFALEWFSKNVYRPGDRVVVVYVPEGHGLLHASKWETRFCKNVYKEGDHVILVYIPEIHSSKWSNAVYVHDPNVMESMLSEEELRIRGDLEVFADKLKVHGLGGRVLSVMSNKPGEGIIKAAEDEDAALIVVGYRGKSSLKRTFAGSVSDFLVHHAHVPVFVCKQRTKTIPSQEL